MLADALEKLYSSGMDLKALHEFLVACMKDKGATAREHVRRLFADDYGGHTYKWEFKDQQEWHFCHGVMLASMT